MNVALFSSTIDITNGYGNITYEYCRALHAKGVQFTLFLPKAEHSLVEKLKPIFDVRCVLPKYIFRLYQDPLMHIFRAVDVSNYDLVHSLFGFPYCLTALRSARKYKKPFLMGEQGSYGVAPLLFFPEAYFLKLCFRAAEHIVVPSDFTRRMILQYANEQYKIDVIHNGVDADRFMKPQDLSALKKKYAGKKILLTVGGLKERKGQDLVIRALPKVVASQPDVMYLLIGSGHLKNSYQELSKSLGVEKYIEFLGTKTGDELVSFFQLADLYVHTPKVFHVYFEGFGIVYLEAGACGIPSVATDSGGVADAVIHGQTGLIVPDGDVDGIAISVIQVLTDTALQERLGQGGRAYAKAHAWSSIVEEFISLYRASVHV